MAVAKWEVQLRPVNGLTDADRQAWALLEGRAVEPNAFMSPHFVLPALKWLEKGKPPVLLWVERAAGGLKELVAVGVFRQSLGTRTFPWPHLTAFQCEHSYLGGLLVDAGAVRPVLEAIQAFLSRSGCVWKGLEMPKVHTTGRLAETVVALSGQRGQAAQLLVRRSGRC